MDLTDHQLHALAGFLARRLRPDGTPVDPFEAPMRGETLHDTWERRLRRARETQEVPRLLAFAAKALPDDPALQEASALAVASPTRNTWLVLTSTVLALLTTAFSTLAATVALAAIAPAAG